MPQMYGLPQSQVPDKIQEKGCTRGGKPRHYQDYRHQDRKARRTLAIADANVKYITIFIFLL